MVARLSDKDYEKFKKISDDQGIKYDSDLDMKQSADSLVRYFEVLIEIDQKELALKEQLKTEPKGFSMPGKGRNCSLCGLGVYDTDGWYDK